MSCISCLVSLLITVVVPLLLTYRAVKQNQDTKLWGIYWAFYSFIKAIFYFMPFLSEPPFNFVFVLFLVWLYHESFKGALLFNKLIANQIQNNPAIATNINLIASKIQFLHIFESEQPIGEKPKTA